MIVKKISKVVFNILFSGFLVSISTFNTLANSTEYKYNGKDFDKEILNGQASLISESNDTGKKFYTIKTANDSIYYLIIDTLRGSENVYFLKPVEDKDLTDFTVKENKNEDLKNVLDSLMKENQSVDSNVLENSDNIGTGSGSAENTTPKTKNDLQGILILVVIGVLIGGTGGFFYLKKAKEKKKLDEFLNDENEEDYLDKIIKEDVEDSDN